MTEKIKDIKKLLEKLDWIKIHKELALHAGYNDQIIIWYDGTISVESTSTIFDTDNEYLRLHTWGRGNTEEDGYADGWCTYDEESGDYIEDGTNRQLTADEMILECIEEGEHDQSIELWKNKLKQQYKDDQLRKGER